MKIRIQTDCFGTIEAEVNDSEHAAKLLCVLQRGGVKCLKWKIVDLGS